jgi:phosphatidylglycerol:prolipoprotein diacylglycerol transferase
MLPVLFHLPTPWGAQPVYAYGLMLALSLIVGYQWTLARARKHGVLSEQHAGNACFLAAIIGLLCGRLLYVASNPMLLEESQARWYELTSGDSMAYGGFFGGALAAFAYLKLKRASFAAFADAAAPAVALGTGLTRIGCYLYGCDFGTPLSDAAPDWLAVLGTFPRWSGEDGLYGSPALFHHLDRYALERGAPHSLPVHPTQLYEVAMAFGLCALALLWERRPRKRFTGELMLLVAAGYAIARYALESLRDEPDKGEVFRFSVAELGSLALLALCALLFSALRRGSPSAPASS